MEIRYSPKDNQLPLAMYAQQCACEREVLVGKGINCNILCPICKNQDETLVHLLRDCLFAHQFWSKIRAPHIIPPLHNQSLCDWLYENCHNKWIHHSNTPWYIIFPFAIWNLWKHRNRVVFDNAPFNLQLHNYCLSQVVEFFFCVGNMRRVKQRVIIQVKWSKPLGGVVQAQFGWGFLWESRQGGGWWSYQRL